MNRKIFLNLIFCLAAISAVVPACRRQPEPLPVQPAASSARPVQAVHVYGTPAEMGEQQGRLFKSEVQFLLREYLDKFINLAGIPIRDSLLESARQMERHMPPEYIEEMRALAQAADVEYDDVLLANTVFDIKKVIFCSTIVANGERSADGAPIFGRNLDFPTLGVAHNFTRVIVYHPTDGRAVASVTFPGCIGVLSGMNDTGLTAAVMEVHRMQANSNAMPYAMLFRHALTTSASTRELVERLEANARSTTNNLMICDADGVAACAELAIDKVAIRLPSDGLIMGTNYFQSEELGAAWPCWRMPLMRRLTSNKVIDDALMRRVLDRVSYSMLTMQSIIFRPQTREMFLASGKPPATKLEYFHLTGDMLFPQGQHTEPRD